MRTILNAHLVYAMVHVPVGIATSAKRQDVEFRTLHDHGTSMSPVGQSKKCKGCGEELTDDQLVKGFEFAKEQYVVIDPEDLDKLKEERSKVIEISKFVPWSDVDDLMVDKSYFLVPSENHSLAKPYVTLSHAMNDANVVAIAKSVLWGKENPAMIWPTDDGALVISILFCHDELVHPSLIINRMGAAGVTPEEIEAASEYISLKVSSLDPQKDLVSKSRDRLNDFLAAKTVGVDFEFVDPQEEISSTSNFMEQLREAIELEKVKA